MFEKCSPETEIVSSKDHNCYFKNFHQSLKDNPRIDLIQKMPRCSVLVIKFLSDKKRVLFSLSNGLLMIYNTQDFAVTKIMFNKSFVTDLVKVIENKYIITAGIDIKVRVWSI